ncbi:MAG: hypothetical protein WAV18_01045, partial [Roseiarcus sp.]
HEPRLDQRRERYKNAGKGFPPPHAARAHSRISALTSPPCAIRPSAHPIRWSTFATACGAHFPPRAVNAATVQRRGDLPKRLGPGGLGLANGRRNAVGEGVGSGHVVSIGDGAGVGELGIAEGLPASLDGGRVGNRALVIAFRLRHELFSAPGRLAQT